VQRPALHGTRPYGRRQRGHLCLYQHRARRVLATSVFRWRRPASHPPRNLHSAALLARPGFEREGYARSYLRIDGKWEDMVLSSLINPAD